MKQVRVWVAVSVMVFAASISATPARALTNSDCIQSSSGLTLTAVASGSRCLITITSGSGSWVSPVGALSISALLVGGGGGGGAGGSRTGNNCSTTASLGTRVGGGGGGGGGGQFKELTLNFNAGQSVSVSIGSGGTAGVPGACGQAGSAGGTGGTTTFDSNSALGGGPGLGGTNRGEGGGGGYSYNSTGVLVSGGTISDPGDCPGTVTVGCMAGASGASPLSQGATPTANGTATSGAAGSEGVAATIITGIFGSGGGGGNRHTGTAPNNTGRSFGAGGTNAGAGSFAGYGVDALANYGGGGGGGRGNGYESAAGSAATNAGYGGAGGSGIVVLSYIPTFTFSLPQPIISGNVYKGINSTITLSIPVTGAVRFFANGKRIATCKSRVTSGSAPNNIASCVWKPNVRGRILISVAVTPTNNAYSSSTSEPLVVEVRSRTNSR